MGVITLTIHNYILYRIRCIIGGTLIWRIAKIPCFADLILAVNAHGHDSNTLVYTWVKSFCDFNIGGPYQNRRSAKLKSSKFKCYMVYAQ